MCTHLSMRGTSLIGAFSGMGMVLRVMIIAVTSTVRKFSFSFIGRCFVFITMSLLKLHFILPQLVRTAKHVFVVIMVVSRHFFA